MVFHQCFLTTVALKPCFRVWFRVCSGLFQSPASWWPIWAVQPDNCPGNPEDLWKWNLWRSSLQERPGQHTLQCDGARQGGPGTVRTCAIGSRGSAVHVWLCVYVSLCICSGWVMAHRMFTLLQRKCAEKEKKNNLLIKRKNHKEFTHNYIHELSTLISSLNTPWLDQFNL